MNYVKDGDWQFCLFDTYQFEDLLKKGLFFQFQKKNWLKILVNEHLG